MKRNPREEFIKDIRNRSKARKIYPKFFYQKCDKCGMEFKFETMYEYVTPSLIFSNVRCYTYGCTECYPSFAQFENEMKNKTEKDIATYLDWQDGKIPLADVN